jgi:hypothetical protein
MKDFWMFDRNLSILENKLEDIQLSIFPNPCSDYCVFDFKGALNTQDMDKMTIRLISLDGKEQINQAITSNYCKIKTDQLKNGIYVYSIEFDNMTVKTGQLIIAN